MLILFLCLLLRPFVHRLVVSLVLMIPLSRWEQVHEVLGSQKLAVSINDSDCDDMTVGIDLAHDCTHDNIPFTVFDELSPLELIQAFIIII